MSVRVMTAVWALSLPDSEKLVLLALADCANDEGHCWPSMATLARKCSKSDRTVQASIKSLVEAGHLTRREVPGKGCNYTVHPIPNVRKMEGYAPPETHYVYRIEDPSTGDFYIGARTCVGNIDDDDYMGSGNWVKEARRLGTALRKLVVEVLPSREALAVAEVAHVQPVFGSEHCRNAKVPTPGTLSGTGYRGDTPEAPAPRKEFTPKRTAPTPEAASDKPSRNHHIGDANASPQPRGKHLLPKDWVLPHVAALPPQAKACAEQWTAASYATHGEAFVCYWRSERKMKSDWPGTWANRVIALHSQVLRDQKNGTAPIDGGMKAAASMSDPDWNAMCERGAEIARAQGKSREAADWVAKKRAPTIAESLMVQARRYQQPRTEQAA